MRADWEGVGIVVLSLLVGGFIVLGVVRTVLRLRAPRARRAGGRMPRPPRTDAEAARTRMPRPTPPTRSRATTRSTAPTTDDEDGR